MTTDTLLYLHFQNRYFNNLHNILYVIIELSILNYNSRLQKLPYPKSVFFIVSNEFCERFSFYGMRSKYIHISMFCSSVIYLFIVLHSNLVAVPQECTGIPRGWCQSTVPYVHYVCLFLPGVRSYNRRQLAGQIQNYLLRELYLCCRQCCPGSGSDTTFEFTTSVSINQSVIREEKRLILSNCWSIYWYPLSIYVWMGS